MYLYNKRMLHYGTNIRSLVLRFRVIYKKMHWFFNISKNEQNQNNRLDAITSSCFQCISYQEFEIHYLIRQYYILKLVLLIFYIALIT